MAFRRLSFSEGLVGGILALWFLFVCVGNLVTAGIDALIDQVGIHLFDGDELRLGFAFSCAFIGACFAVVMHNTAIDRANKKVLILLRFLHSQGRISQDEIAGLEVALKDLEEGGAS